MLPRASGLEARSKLQLASSAMSWAVPASEVMVASTGVIGVHLNMATFETGAPLALEALSREGGRLPHAPS